ncbi:MAG: ZIP family metal transporter [Planctomycetota bacterium]|nr:MAG: ZIP family metal transporter [Planctomycetota bacterium]
MYQIALTSFIAGIFACIACGLGALPLFFSKRKVQQQIGLGYGFAGGMMFSASVYNLLLPALTYGDIASPFGKISQLVIGIALGCFFLWKVESFLTPERLEKSSLHKVGGKTEILVFLAMLLHSLPEGVAVGVGFASEPYLSQPLGTYIAIAIAIHNIPEGLAVALPLRLNGSGFWKCFWMAFFSSVPQPLASVPAALAVWFFQPLMIPLLGFSAGSMMYLVLSQILPSALETHSPTQIAWSFMIGFCLMAFVQISF